MQNPSENVLLHFTSLDGLKGILMTTAFWLTHYRDMEDKSELHAINPTDIERTLYTSGFLPKDVTIFREVMDQALKKMSTGPYIASFYSMEKSNTSNTKRMWSSYGKDNLALVFNQNKLIEQINIATQQRTLELNISYNKDLLKNFGESLKQHGLQRLQTHSPSDRATDINSLACIKALGDRPVADQYMKMRWMTKKRKYRWENEYRILLSETKSDTIFEELTRINKAEKKRYIQIPLNQLQQCIEYILIGPNSAQHKTMRKIRQILIQANMEGIEIRKSEN